MHKKRHERNSEFLHAHHIPVGSIMLFMLVRYKIKYSLHAVSGIHLG